MFIRKKTQREKLEWISKLPRMVEKRFTKYKEFIPAPFPKRKK